MSQRFLILQITSIFFPIVLTSQNGPYELYIYHNESHCNYWKDHLDQYAHIVQQAVFHTYEELTGHPLNYNDTKAQIGDTETSWSRCGISNWKTCMLFNVKLDHVDNCPSVSNPSSKYAEYAVVAEYYVESDGDTNNCQNNIMYVFNNKMVVDSDAMEQSHFSKLVAIEMMHTLERMDMYTHSTQKNDADSDHEPTFNSTASSSCNFTINNEPSNHGSAVDNESLSNITTYNTTYSFYSTDPLSTYDEFNPDTTFNVSLPSVHLSNNWATQSKSILYVIAILLIMVCMISLVYVCKYKGMYNNYFKPKQAKYKNVRMSDKNIEENHPSDESNVNEEPFTATMSNKELETFVISNLPTIVNILIKKNGMENIECSHDTVTETETQSLNWTKTLTQHSHQSSEIANCLIVEDNPSNN